MRAQRQLRHEPDLHGARRSEVRAERAAEQHLRDLGGVDAHVVAEDLPAGRDRGLRELQLAHVALREKDVAGQMEDVLLADLPEPLRRAEHEAARVVEDAGADELGHRVDEAGAAETERLDVADHRQLTSPSTILTPSIAPSAARMPQRIWAASNAGPAGARRRECPRGRPEHDLRVGADVDEEPYVACRASGPSPGCRPRCRARRRRRAPGTARPARARAPAHRRSAAVASGSWREAIVNGAIESGSGSMPSASWIIVTLPATTIS